MLGLVVHIFCTFIFATRVVVCWQKRERERERKFTILTNWIFFLALSDQEFTWGKLWQIFSQTGERVLQITDYWCFHALRILLFLHKGRSDQWIVHTNKQKKEKKKKKRENYYSEVTLVLLHYSEHIEDTHFLWTLSHRPFPSIPDWTGSNCYAQPNWHCRFLEPFWVCVVREVLSKC